MNTVTELPTNRVLEKRIEELTDVVSQLLSVLYGNGTLDDNGINEFAHGAALLKSNTASWRRPLTASPVAEQLQGQAIAYKLIPDARNHVLALVARDKAEIDEYCNRSMASLGASRETATDRKGG